jgi:hypothetical protein
MITDWETVSDRNADNPLGLESNFMSEDVARALHARLFCGVKFFGVNKAMNAEIAPCIVKMACKQLAIMNAKGALIEQVTQAELEFAANGDISRRAYTHPLCKDCDQDLCPVWKMAHGKGSAKV